ncbi:hypothetical protein HOK68_00205 [Candidatus Woesearchaeota archaeon]|nr:hypothetical protein [Candidatus Woesearchaeota archaeon]MBT4387812.1 hypothetical protein [Candidatus Woesearchaeota archaeon]MBT4595631.1 hypothetical protein [Candidatus Woesearchaeota archaeon]MBT5740886.1 hypothetical protein [Candidatus Woesearchaeota archaeon]MBT6505183.1 hypothetical protein [Candidatus Woesearchaeota archaeon]
MDLSEISSDVSSTQHIVNKNFEENDSELKKLGVILRSQSDQISRYLHSENKMDFSMSKLSGDVLDQNRGVISTPRNNFSKQIYSIFFVLNKIGEILDSVSKAILIIDSEEIEFLTEHFAPGNSFESNQNFIKKDLNKDIIARGNNIVTEINIEFNKCELNMIQLEKEIYILSKLIEEYNLQIVKFSNSNNNNIKDRAKINFQLVENLNSGLNLFKDNLDKIKDSIEFDRKINIYLKKLHAEIRHEGYNVESTILGRMWNSLSVMPSAVKLIRAHRLDQNVYFLIYLDLMLRYYKLMEMNYQKLYMAKPNNVAFENLFNEAMRDHDKIFLEKLKPLSVKVIDIPFRTETKGSGYLDLLLILKHAYDRQGEPDYNKIFKSSKTTKVIASLIINNFHFILNRKIPASEDMLRISKFIRDMETKLKLQHNQNIAINENKIGLAILDVDKSVKNLNRPYFELLSKFSSISIFLEEFFKSEIRSLDKNQIN